MHDVQSIAESVVAGESDSQSLSDWSHFYWNRGDFLHQVDLSPFAGMKVAGPLTQRYAGTSEVAHRVLYGCEGRPGCVVVDAPAEHRYDGRLEDLLVPLHCHASDHVAVVLGGGGTFVVQRKVRGKDVLLMAESGPGTILFYPAGIFHTFVSGPGGIRVASAQAQHESPGSRRFADPAPKGLAGLPRMDYRDYLGAATRTG